jgi:hypothetical protein
MGHDAIGLDIEYPDASELDSMESNTGPEVLWQNFTCLGTSFLTVAF